MGFMNKQLIQGIVVVIAVLIIIVFFVVMRGGVLPGVSTPAIVENQNQLAVQDIAAGAGDEAVLGKTVRVHYVGTLADGTKFDSSRDRGSPFQFTLGAGGVIPGWEQGIIGMKVGGTRILVIPPSLGYGERGVKNQAGEYVIPPNATLIFEVELLEVK